MNVKRLAALGLIIGSGGVVTVGCTVGGSSTGGTGGTGTGSTTVTSSGSTTATTSATTATTSASTTSSGGGMCTDPGAPTGATVGTTDCGNMPCMDANTCAEVCSALFDCGLAKCGPGGAALCMYAPSTHDAFINGGCVPSCMAAPAGTFKPTVDPTNCDMTITTNKTNNGTFKTFCETGAAG